MMCNPAALSRLYLDVVAGRLGAGATAEPDGKVRVEVDGVTYVLHNHAPRHPHVLHVSVGYRHEPHVGLECARDAAAEVNVRSLCAKAMVLESGVIFSAEMAVAPRDCLPTADHLAVVLPVALHCLADAVDLYLVEVDLTGIAAATAAAEAGAADELE